MLFLVNLFAKKEPGEVQGDSPRDKRTLQELTSPRLARLARWLVTAGVGGTANRGSVVRYLYTSSEVSLNALGNELMTPAHHR
jgi:hypothetical protein